MNHNIIKAIRKIFLFTVLLVAASLNVIAEKTSIDGLFRYQLDNGLEIYIAENHNVPLVYVELAVRVGAITQTKETSGLFHLYEHMMFKGNSLYKDSASVNKALADLGVTDHNGTTSTDCVNYYFTIPSSKLEEGLAFWNAAIRSPLITEKEFENEKKVVLSEIEGDQANPSFILHYFSNLLMFPEVPYRTDPRGSYDVVRNATVAQMRIMQQEFYIPCNTAVFIGGDINPDSAYELVKNIFGSWSNNGKVVPVKVSQASKTPLNETKFIVMPFDKISPELAEVQLSWRAPDMDYDYEDLCYASYLDYIMDNPDSLVKNKLSSNAEYKIPDRTYVGSFLSAGRGNSLMGCYALMTDPSEKLAERAKKIASEIQDVIYVETVSDKKEFSRKKLNKYNEIQNDALEKASETAEGLVCLARKCWIDGDLEYLFGEKKSPSINQKKVKSFVNQYVTSKKPLVTVLVNPGIYEKVAKEFSSAGFYEVKKDEELWWKRSEFKVDVKSFPKVCDYSLDNEIYVPTGNGSSNNKEQKSRNVEVFTLKNGIKVYVQHNSSKMNAIAIGCMGGYEKFSPEYSGLEGNLFDVMASSSVKYSMEERNKMQYENSVSIDKFSRTVGSVLYMYGQEKYFDKMLPVFVDGFLNPKFAENVMKNIQDGNAQRVQRMENDPQSILSRMISKEIYKGHPYETTAGVTPESIANMSVENMKKLHGQIVGGGDFFIVASGNVKSRKLKSQLEKSIGKLVFDPKLKYEMKSIPTVKIGKRTPMIATHPSALGTAHAARVFASPEIKNPDVTGAILAANIYSDTLYNVVREHYGICYTPYSSVITSKAPISEDILFKVSDYKNVGKAMKEAESYMQKGLIVEKCNEDGKYVFCTIAENLESYKSKWINSTFSQAKSTSGQMFRVMTNIMYYDDINYDQKELDEMKKVTADDVVRIFNKYWVEGNSVWFAVTFPGNEKNLVFE